MSNLKVDLTALQEIAKERTVKTQSLEYDLETLVKKIKKGVIKLDPDYQRRHRWDNETSSRLIESLILNIPIPTIYLSQDVDVDTETEESRYSVIDGQQRLTAIFNFLNNKFSLQGLDTLTELNGCYYKDLPPFLIRRLEERTIKCLRIDSTIDTQIKIDIFERLNSGSIKLEPQELRNAVLGGAFNDLCKSLSQTSNFRTLLQIKPDKSDSNNRVQKMEDVELVLRFFALINGNYKNFRKTKEKGFKDFLSDIMDEYNKKDPAEYEALKNEFDITFNSILKNFGNTAFAKYKYEKGELVLQSKFNNAVFDALSVSCHDLIVANPQIKFERKANKFKNLFKDKTFYESVSGSYLDINKLSFRIEKAFEVLS
jgi:uncharacterized protein with ParB-like and HNH nuclease domain